jgi:predicted PurR-regulated permease PerM
LYVAFFLFRDGGRALAQASAIVAKVAGAEGGRLLEIAGTTVRAVVYGVLGTSILEGTLVAIGFWISGVPGVALLGFCTFILAFIPVGPILVWLPACVWLFRECATGWAIFLAVWSVVMGTVSDNVVKPLLISRGGSTPLILVMLGVLGGVVAFGFIGIFVGPTLLAVGYHVLEEWSPGPAQ